MVKTHGYSMMEQMDLGTWLERSYQRIGRKQPTSSRPRAVFGDEGQDE